MRHRWGMAVSLPARTTVRDRMSLADDDIRPRAPCEREVRNMRASSVDGLLVVDKPGGMTSRDAVNRAQGWFPRGTRLGHTGTLDPLATGVLVLCVGSATRLTEYVQQMGKTYRTTVLLGARSDTDDADGTVTPVDGARPPTRDELERCL